MRKIVIGVLAVSAIGCVEIASATFKKQSSAYSPKQFQSIPNQQGTQVKTIPPEIAAQIAAFAQASQPKPAQPAPAPAKNVAVATPQVSLSSRVSSLLNQSSQTGKAKANQLFQQQAGSLNNLISALQQPKIQQPRVQQPKIQQPQVQQPQVQQPKIQQPRVQQPKIQQPQVQRPQVHPAPVIAPARAGQRVANPVANPNQVARNTGNGGGAVAVSEPSSLLMLALGLITFGLSRRKLKK